MMLSRRWILSAVLVILASLPARAAELPRPKAEGAVLRIDPVPRFELSPHLYMQFMEPLGTTDSSVEAAWSQQREAWRKDVVEATLTLAGMSVASATALEIAADPEFEVINANDALAPKQKDLPKDGRWTFPAASVTAVEAEVNDQ